MLAVFLVPAAAPAVVHNLTYARQRRRVAAPGRAVADPLALARGALKAVFVWVACRCLCLQARRPRLWGDALAGALHAILAGGLTWVMLLASLWLVARAWPFSLPPARGSALAVPPVPTLALGALLFTLAGAHALLATYPAYWVAVLAALPLAAWWLRGHAAKRLAQLGRPGA